ncbi:MAG: hypothetical protein ACTHKB_09425, partial [Burkholderiaceae bacterium]
MSGGLLDAAAKSDYLPFSDIKAGAAAWQPEVVALATPVVIEPCTIYCLNFSVSSEKTATLVAAELADPLLDLAEKVRRAIIVNR